MKPCLCEPSGVGKTIPLGLEAKKPAKAKAEKRYRARLTTLLVIELTSLIPASHISRCLSGLTPPLNRVTVREAMAKPLHLNIDMPHVARISTHRDIHAQYGRLTCGSVASPGFSQGKPIPYPMMPNGHV
jgi:hypothetical protein